MPKKINPKPAAGTDLAKAVMDAAKAEPIPGKIVRLAEELDAALKNTSPDREKL